ncbi:hypothetical protein KIW84_045474 [Lathyrus oleraceus]|uniref:Uncharacterized protein n=1 Tax=Pisum sativum TaxID=3888 RepID=A0A9D5AX97_PEA|nr:hypothetical protein KIW84_045474 [Pisum sativum]
MGKKDSLKSKTGHNTLHVEADKNTLHVVDSEKNSIQDFGNVDNKSCDKDSVSSLDTDFVDATQMFHEDNYLEIVEETALDMVHQDVQHDMLFLQHSWANIEDLEMIANQDNLNGFQTIKSKKKSKSQKSKSRPQYGTRSRAEDLWQNLNNLLVDHNILGLHDKVNAAESNLTWVQEKTIEEGYSDRLAELERSAQSQLDLALFIEELFWKEKSKEDNLIEKVIPDMMNEQSNNLLTVLPSQEEIHNAVMILDKDSAPGPDGFGGFFFEHYCEIIKKDVIMVVTQFFTDGWILPNYNANTLVLIPKTPSADAIEHYRPIALANFKHKIVTKIIADRVPRAFGFNDKFCHWIIVILRDDEVEREVEDEWEVVDE